MSHDILGLVSVSFRKHTPEEILTATRDAGLTCIEWGSDVHAPPHDTQRLQEIAQFQATYGIKCCSYGTYFRLGQTPISDLPTYIRAAKLLGTQVLRLWCGTKAGKDMTEAEREALLADSKQAADMAEAHGVTLCMECHCGTFTQDPDDAVWLMEEVNSPAFGMYWQPFQCLSTEGSLAVAKKVAPYVKHIHVFNWQGSEKYPLSEGIADWQAYLSVFARPRTLLLEFMPDDRIETLQEEAKALKIITGDNS